MTACPGSTPLALSSAAKASAWLRASPTVTARSMVSRSSSSSAKGWDSSREARLVMTEACPAMACLPRGQVPSESQHPFRHDVAVDFGGSSLDGVGPTSEHAFDFVGEVGSPLIWIGGGRCRPCRGPGTEEIGREQL